MTDKQVTENMTLAPGVVDTIISLTAKEHEGVAQVGSGVTSGFFAKLANKPSTSGIETHFEEDGKLHVVLHLQVYYGFVLPELAEKLRQAISDALLVQVGVEVSSIDVFVDGVVFDRN